MTATDLRQMIGRKEISPVEIVEASIDRIEMVDSSLNAIVTKIMKPHARWQKLQRKAF